MVQKTVVNSKLKINYYWQRIERNEECHNQYTIVCITAENSGNSKFEKSMLAFWWSNNKRRPTRQILSDYGVPSWR